MKKAGICGHLGGNNIFYDGQTIKTVMLKVELTNKVGSNQIITVDTYKWKNRLPLFMIEILKMFNRCENIVILPAQNGIKIFLPIFIFFNLFFKRKIHYSVIGGWLPQMVTQKKYMIYLLSKLDNIFVETKKMSNELFDMGLLNVSIVPNFKRIRILDKKEMPSEYNKPYKICTFSRVNYKKGITDAISVVKKINRNRGEIKFKLDIYGQIDQDFFSEFNELLEDNSVFVEYCGVISPKASSEVIKDYFMLLFPTRYKTEGIPGTLIDAYAAGVPVIGSNWDSAEQIIKNNVTGYIYEFENIDHLYRIMEHTLQNPDEVLAMKDNCLEEANMYSPENALENMMVKLDL